MNNSGKKIVITLSLSLIAFGTLYGLNYWSLFGKRTHNNFARNFKSRKPQEFSRTSTSSKHYVAGMYKDELYFYNANPRKILRTDLKLINKGTISLPKDSIIDQLFSAYRAKIYESELEFYALNKAAIYKFDLLTGSIQEVSLPRNYSRIIRLSDASYIIKGFDGTYKNQELYKINSSKEVVHSNFLEHTNDAGFATDGNLLYDAESQTILYVYLNSNQLLLMDTNLNLIKKANTIDTFSHYNIIAKEKHSKNDKPFFTLSKPTEYINYCCYVNQGLLYINSLVKADNENTNDFRDNSVIDVYKAQTGRYLYSFYVPKHKNEGLRSFIVSGNQMYATYPAAIIAYQLNF